MSPWAPKRRCSRPGCPHWQPCPAHAGTGIGWRDRPSSAAGRRLRGDAWMRLRRQVLTEEPCCAYCGRPGQPDDVIDHVLALSRGGSNDRGNLRRACRDCNERKRRGEARR